MENSETLESPNQIETDQIEANFTEAPLSPVRLLRLAGKSLIAQLAIYGQLFVIEWAEEKNRLLKQVLAMLLGFAFLLSLLFFSGMLALALSWETIYRVPVMITLMLFYAFGLVIAVWRLKFLLTQGKQPFIAMREELSLDIALIKSKL